MDYGHPSTSISTYTMPRQITIVLSWLFWFLKNFICLSRCQYAYFLHQILTLSFQYFWADSHFLKEKLHFLNCCMWSDQKHSITSCTYILINAATVGLWLLWLGKEWEYFERWTYIHTYILFDGLTYRGEGPQGRGKMRAMSKMSASIIC